MKPDQQRNSTETDSKPVSLDLEHIGAESLGKLKQGFDDKVLHPLRENAERCFQKIGDFCQSRANKMVGYAVAVAQGQGAQATSQALEGFRGNIVDGLKKGSEAAVEGLKFVGQTGSSTLRGVEAGASFVLDRTKQGLQEFQSSVEELFKKGSEAYKEFQSGVRNSEIKKFSEKQQMKIGNIAEPLQSQARKEAAEEIKAQAHTAIQEAYKHAIDSAKKENGGILTEEVRTDLKHNIKDCLKQARGMLWKQRAGEVMDERVAEMREKLAAAGLSNEDKARAEKAITAGHTRYETSLQMRGDKAPNRSEPRIASKFADSMEQDLDRRIAVLQRIEKIERAGRNITTIDGGKVDDQSTKDIVTELRQRFEDHTEDSKFSLREFMEMQGDINVAALRVASLGLRQGMVDILGVKASELKSPETTEGAETEDE
jgi:translation initiation factor 1 (eIF-1/SUI1)